MANKTQATIQGGPLPFKRFMVSASKTTAIFAGDKVWHDKANNVAVSARDFPWQGSEIATQRAFRRVFLGISMDASPAGSNTPTGTFLSQASIRVIRTGEALDACASATLVRSSYVCPAKVSGVNALEPQTVKVITDPSAAIGMITMEESKGTSLASQTSTTYEFQGVSDLPIPGTEGPVVLADPGASGAIPVTEMNAIVPLVSAAAEARSLADPTALGQRLTICMDTDGGDITLTAASDITQTAGENVATFGDVGDTINLISVSVSGAYKWRLVGATATQQGVALT